ncbi:MAG: DUF305 domain-containing protein [Actinomycetota bacterium]|nr:DUF305 domain-containing protein [Actinomycetota bacterium]
MTLRPPVRPRLAALPAALIALALALGVTACGQEAGPAAAGGGHNQADVAFAHLMVHHHEHGVEMARLAQEKGSKAEVKELGARITSTQEREIAQMEGFLEEFGAVGQGPVAPPIKKAVEEKELADLEAASGEEFDKLFLEAMVHHHVSAADMAEYELLAGQHPPSKGLAQAIKDVQLKEVEEMHHLLAPEG